MVEPQRQNVVKYHHESIKDSPSRRVPLQKVDEQPSSRSRSRCKSPYSRFNHYMYANKDIKMALRLKSRSKSKEKRQKMSIDSGMNFNFTDQTTNFGPIEVF